MSGEEMYLTIINRPYTTGGASVGSIIAGLSLAKLIPILTVISLSLGSIVAILSIIGFIIKFRNGKNNRFISKAD